MTVLGGWGQTENGLVTLGSRDRRRSSPSVTAIRVPGMHHQDCRRCRRQWKSVLPAGESGQLQVRGPFDFVRYARRLELTRELFFDGFFDTGDLAYLDEKGYLKLSGRTKDVIIRGGENISGRLRGERCRREPEDRLGRGRRHRGSAAAGAGLRLRRVAGVEEFTFEEMKAFRPTRASPNSTGRSGRGAADAAVHGERQDPEVQLQESGRPAGRPGGRRKPREHRVPGRRIRTPFGRYGGALSSVRTDDLAAHVLRGLVDRLPSVDWDALDDVVLGCANQAGEDAGTSPGWRRCWPSCRSPSRIDGQPTSRFQPGRDRHRLPGGPRRRRRSDPGRWRGSMSRAPFVIPKATSAFSRSTEIHDTTIGWRFVNPVMRSTCSTDRCRRPRTTWPPSSTSARPTRTRSPCFPQQDRAGQGHRLRRLAREIAPVSIPAAPKWASRDRRHRRAPAGDLVGGRCAKLKPTTRAAP